MARSSFKQNPCRLSPALHRCRLFGIFRPPDTDIAAEGAMAVHRSCLLGVLLLIASPPAAFAQSDFVGNWAPLYHEDHPERIPGPELGDYLGIPLNEAGRLRADSYDADRISVVQEYQCRPHAGDYMMRGLANMRVDAILDPLTQRMTAIHLRMNFQEMERTIYLDGRPHPSAERRPHVVGVLDRHLAGQRARTSTPRISRKTTSGATASPRATSARSPSTGCGTATI